jgi:hypothetical protein
MTREQLNDEIARLRRGAHPDSHLQAVYGVCRKLLDGQAAHVSNLPAMPGHNLGETWSRMYRIALRLTNERWGKQP